MTTRVLPVLECPSGAKLSKSFSHRSSLASSITLSLSQGMPKGLSTKRLSLFSFSCSITCRSSGSCQDRKQGPNRAVSSMALEIAGPSSTFSQPFFTSISSNSCALHLVM